MSEFYPERDVLLARQRVRAVVACFGINPRTGRRVGSKHRWQERGGVSSCIWCGRTMEVAYQEQADRDERIRQWADARDREDKA